MSVEWLRLWASCIGRPEPVKALATLLAPWVFRLLTRGHEQRVRNIRSRAPHWWVVNKMSFWTEPGTFFQLVWSWLWLFSLRNAHWLIQIFGAYWHHLNLHLDIASTGFAHQFTALPEILFQAKLGITGKAHSLPWLDFQMSAAHLSVEKLKLKVYLFWLECFINDIVYLLPGNISLWDIGGQKRLYTRMDQYSRSLCCSSSQCQQLESAIQLQ